MQHPQMDRYMESIGKWCGISRIITFCGAKKYGNKDRSYAIVEVIIIVIIRLRVIIIKKNIKRRYAYIPAGPIWLYLLTRGVVISVMLMVFVIP